MKKERILQIIIFILIFVLAFYFIFVSSHSFKQGWSKDCENKIGIIEKKDLPFVCQDFGKYHMMFIGIAVLMGIVLALVCSFLLEEKQIR